MFGFVGSLLNDITGVSSSAKQQAQEQQRLQTDAQNFTKWQMENAHQMEVQDLKNAGLNPVLSAGGDGAGGTPSMGSASTGVASDPISMIMNLINTAKNAEKTDSEIKNIDADTQNKQQTFTWTPKINKSIIEYNNAQSGKLKSEKILNVEKTIAQQLQNQLSTMDVEKRKEFFGKEKELYEAEIKAGLVEMGLNGDEAVRVVERAFETVGKLFGGSVSHNYNASTTKTTNTIKHVIE